MYMILMLLIQELPYLYFLVIFLFFLVRLFYNATSTDAGKTRQGSKYSIQLVIISSIRGTSFPSKAFLSLMKTVIGLFISTS